MTVVAVCPRGGSVRPPLVVPGVSRRVAMISAVTMDSDTRAHARLRDQPCELSRARRPGRRGVRTAEAVDPAVDRDVRLMPGTDRADVER